MSVWRILNPDYTPPEKYKFYEISKPHGMWHGDVMIGKRLSDGTFLYQLSWQDDYSRGYVASLIGTSKTSVLVIKGLIEAIMRYEVLPTLVHYDNGTEGKCKIVEVFCESLGIKLIHSTVNQPNTNGKKERAHRDDRRDFWSEVTSENIGYVRRKNEAYVEWRNKQKGHWALGGKPSIVRLEENRKVKHVFSRDYLESLARVKVGLRKVRSGGLVFVPGGVEFVEREYVGKVVELWETVVGLGIEYKGKVVGVVENYWENVKKGKSSAVPQT